MDGNAKDALRQGAHFGSAGDKGVDVAGFCDARGFKGNWDGFQCKHRDHPLRPTDVYADIGKLIWHVSTGEYTCPRYYRFVGSRDVGTKLNQLLHDPAKLKAEVAKQWDTAIAGYITEKTSIKLAGAVKACFDAFDFSIFGHEKLQTILDGLHGSIYYTATFGGGLPPRPEPPVIIPPESYDRWLSTLDPNPRDLLVPYPAGPMRIWPISTRVNKPVNDDESILEPVGI